MSKTFRYFVAGVLLACLILIRKYETVLFYDPFLRYFHGIQDYAHYPDYDLTKLIISICFRYALNTILSVSIIGILFNNRRYITFSSIVYFVFFMLLLPLYSYLVLHYFELGQNIGFYIRRLLIQPVLLLILLPAFLYLRISGGNSIS